MTAQACRTDATTLPRACAPAQPPKDLICRPRNLRKSSTYLPLACNLCSYVLAELRATTSMLPTGSADTADCTDQFQVAQELASPPSCYRPGT
jgi:hypothetical protein